MLSGRVSNAGCQTDMNFEDLVIFPQRANCRQDHQKGHSHKGIKNFKTHGTIYIIHIQTVLSLFGDNKLSFVTKCVQN